MEAKTNIKWLPLLVQGLLLSLKFIIRLIDWLASSQDCLCPSPSAVFIGTHRLIQLLHDANLDL